jgi:predicted metal-dependent hydrolase
VRLSILVDRKLEMIRHPEFDFLAVSPRDWYNGDTTSVRMFAHRSALLKKGTEAD